MKQVLLSLLLIDVLALSGVILLQRSEGGLGGLGGGGGGLSGLMSSRGQANFLTKATAILAAIFFILALLLSVVEKRGNTQGSLFTAPPSTTTSSTPLKEDTGAGSGAVEPSQPSVPQAQ